MQKVGLPYLSLSTQLFKPIWIQFLSVLSLDNSRIAAVTHIHSHTHDTKYTTLIAEKMLEKLKTTKDQQPTATSHTAASYHQQQQQI